MISGCVAAAVAAFTAPALAASDPYESLKAMNGHWVATTSGGRTQTIDNQCAPTGLFFVCEQAVGGQPTRLVVFLPNDSEGRKLVFHTQTLDSAGDRAGPWHQLTIEGDRWTYADLERRHGVKRRERTVVTQSGPDFMHAEIQASTDGETWITVSSENLTRAP